jgi:squalene-hopene/tetraprenyl-beta-curcumene cyclase
MVAGDVHSEAAQRAADWLVARQQTSGPLQGLWHHPTFTAPGFPRVFYLKYHGYTAYFPLWALACYRQLRAV